MLDSNQMRRLLRYERISRGIIIWSTWCGWEAWGEIGGRKNLLDVWTSSPTGSFLTIADAQPSAIMPGSTEMPSSQFDLAGIAGMLQLPPFDLASCLGHRSRGQPCSGWKQLKLISRCRAQISRFLLFRRPVLCLPQQAGGLHSLLAADSCYAAVEILV